MSKGKPTKREVARTLTSLGDEVRSRIVCIGCAFGDLNGPDPDPLMDEALDELVHEEASKVGSAINNEGREAQVRYLLEKGYTHEEITQYVFKLVTGLGVKDLV